MKDNLSDFTSPDQIWNKWYNLLRLRKKGFCVPDTFVIDISYINECVSFKDNDVAFENIALFSEYLSFLDKDSKYIFRSSTTYEDSNYVTFAWMFESKISRWSDFFSSIKTVLKSYFSEQVKFYSNIYDICIDKQNPKIAILIQEFHTLPDYSGVALIDNFSYLIEFCRWDNLQITSWKWDKQIFYIRWNERQLPIGCNIWEITSVLSRAKGSFYKSSWGLFEWKIKDGLFTFIQMRPFNYFNIPKYLNYASFLSVTDTVMISLWFTWEEYWILAEKSSLEFRYITDNLSQSPFNTELIIFLFVDNDDRRVINWMKVKDMGLLKVKKPRLWLCKYLDQLNSILNLDYEFCLIPSNKRYNFSFYHESNLLIPRSDFLLNINTFTPYCFGDVEEFISLNRNIIKKICISIRNSLESIPSIIRGIHKDTICSSEFKIELIHNILRERDLCIDILHHINKSKLLYSIPTKDNNIFGHVVVHWWILEWEIISREDMNKLQLTTTTMNYIYFSYDFDMYYLQFLHKISWMILERWSHLSHGAIICRELWVPLICWLDEDLRVKSWDIVTVDFSSWKISQL